MASVASQLIEEVTAHAQSDNLEDAWEICADGAYFPNNLRKWMMNCGSSAGKAKKFSMSYNVPRGFGAHPAFKQWILRFFARV